MKTYSLPIYKTLAVLLLILSGSAQAQTTDTVRITDPRFLFSNLTDSSYFYTDSPRYGHALSIDVPVQAIDADSSIGTLHNIAYTMVYPVDNNGVMVYGLALSMSYESEHNWNTTLDTRLPWDHYNDTIWLKLRRGKKEGYIDGDKAIDSVRINLWSEKKTLLLEGCYANLGVFYFDSVVVEPLPLYCAYFNSPVYIRDTNFFVSLELVSHFSTLPSMDAPYPGFYVPYGHVSPNVTRYTYYTSLIANPYGELGWHPRSEPEWPVIIPIIAPKENPSSIDKADNFDLKIYPNPARRQFSVQSGVQVLRVEMYDVMGRKVREWGNSSQNYDLDGIPSGLYMVKLTTPSASITKRLQVSDSK